MTEQPTPPIPPGIPVPEVAPVAVVARKGSKLEQLHDLYYALKAEKDEADKKYKAVCDAIKVEVTSANAEARRFSLSSKSGDRPALNVSYTESNRFDSTRFKKEHPDVYVGYLKPSASWSIRPAGSDGE